jgi:hypothetical protein
MLTLMLIHFALAQTSATGPNASMDVHVPIRAITRGPKGHWFGYYDKLQFDQTGRYALGAEVAFQDRAPTADNAIRLGMIDLQYGDKWIDIGDSRAWSRQQGCMLQWLPGSGTKVIYNDREGDHYVSRIKDVVTDESRTLPKPIYAVTSDGARAVRTNFARIDSTRPGYGYKGVIDPGADDLHPTNDGIYVMDLDTGDWKLIITYDQIARIPQDTKTEGKHWFNHLLFNPSGTRFIFLHRAHPSLESKTAWVTRMFTASADGTDLFCVADHTMVSHFIWKDDKHIVA